MGEWHQITLGDFVSLQRGHDLTESQRQSGCVPIMGSAGLAGYHNAAKAKGPGVSIGRSGVGSVGVVSYCRTDYWPHNTVLYVTDFHGNDPLFAYYFLKSLNLRNYDSGSAQSSLNRNYLYPIKMTVPTPKEQRAIAHILGTLDDKIELNRRMNETLEALARAIFKSWFVDFDPVRAKMEGRQPVGMDAETAALFPAEFEDSALGLIPKGWKVGPLEEIADIVMGQSPPGETYNEEGNGLSFYQGTRDFGFRFPSRRIYCTAPTRFAEKDDVLLSVRAPVGELNLAIERSAIGRGVAALRLKPQQGGFLYYLLKETQNGWKKFEAEGTVFGSATKEDVTSFKVIISPAEIRGNYSEIVDPFDQMIRTNHEEMLTLAALRDTLLPKLLSGEVRVEAVNGL